MTGFGRGSREAEGKKITVEIKSLNSKQMDISSRVPTLLKEKEIEIRSMITSKLIRGKVDLFVMIEDESDGIAGQINGNVIESYYKQIKQISASCGIPEPTDWSVVLRLPDALKSEAHEDLSEAVWEATHQATEEALEKLVEFRTQEGRQLQGIFDEKIKNISARLTEVEPYEAGRVDKIKARLRENLEQLTKEYDKNRFEQELIFYIEKLDISEEKNRLSNHLQYFIKTMNEEVAPGKKLGFIAQEMGREINTLGSKSNQSEMQILVVKMKDELEQIKEQVLNTL